MTSKTLFGTTTVTLGDDEYTLTPSLDAARKIEARFGGLRPALDSLGNLGVDACAVVIVAGAGLSQKEAKDVPDAVFAAGVGDVAAQVVPFIVALLNPAQAKIEEESGNVKEGSKSSAVKDGSYVDYLYGLATGWLGWSPAEAWSTPIPELLLAYEAKTEFLKATNPFGSGEEKPDKGHVARDVKSGLRLAAALRPDAE